MKIESIIVLLFLLIVTACVYSQESIERHKSLATVFENIKETMIDDHKRDESFDKILQNIKLTYEKPDFAFPIISFHRAPVPEVTLDEFRDSNLTIISDRNKNLLDRNYWRGKIFHNNYISPLKVVKTIKSFVEKEKIVIAIYSWRNPSADIVVFEKKDGILYPIFIYPSIVSGSMYGSQPRFMKTFGDTITIGSSTGDGGDYWGDSSVFIINKNKCELLSHEYYSGWSGDIDNKTFVTLRIYTTHYNADGSEKNKEFDCYAKYEDGSSRFRTTKNDSIKLFYINPEWPYRLLKVYKKVFVEDRRVEMSGPGRGNATPIWWDNEKYFIRSADLIRN